MTGNVLAELLRGARWRPWSWVQTDPEGSTTTRISRGTIEPGRVSPLETLQGKHQSHFTAKELNPQPTSKAGRRKYHTFLCEKSPLKQEAAIKVTCGSVAAGRQSSANLMCSYTADGPLSRRVNAKAPFHKSSHYWVEKSTLPYKEGARCSKNRQNTIKTPHNKKPGVKNLDFVIAAMQKARPGGTQGAICGGSGSAKHRAPFSPPEVPAAQPISGAASNQTGPAHFQPIRTALQLRAHIQDGDKEQQRPGTVPPTTADFYWSSPGRRAPAGGSGRHRCCLKKLQAQREGKRIRYEANHKLQDVE